jgi:hypothetical protein
MNHDRYRRANLSATPNMMCADVSFITNVFIDRGITSDIFARDYHRGCCHDWCPHCINAKYRAMLYICNNLAIFASNTLSKTDSFPLSGALILQVLRQCRNNFCIEQKYLMKHITLDRESAMLLLQKSQYHPKMHAYIDRSAAISTMINGAIDIVNEYTFSILFRYCNIDTIGLIIAKLRKNAESMTPDIVLIKYYFLYYNINMISRDVIIYHWADLSELFPLLILESNAQTYLRDDLNLYELTPEICPLDIVDRAMSFSNMKSYKYIIHHLLHRFVIKAVACDHFNELGRLIIEKHPEYVRCLYRNSADISAPISFMGSLFLPEYDCANILFNNIHRDCNLLKYVPINMRHLIRIDDINTYINDIIYENTYISHGGNTITMMMINHNTIIGGYNLDEPNIYYTLHDVIQINNGIEFADINAAQIDAQINAVLNSGFRSIILRPINKISYDHILRLVRRNINVINMLFSEIVKTILPILYAEFWESIRAINIIMRQYNMPRDIADMIKLHYIKPTANDADVDRMLAATCE